MNHESEFSPVEELLLAMEAAERPQIEIFDSWEQQEVAEWEGTTETTKGNLIRKFREIT